MDPKRPGRLLKDENDTFEAKVTFHTKGAQFAKYARTAAGFANAGGGCLVFGVKDKTLEVMGLPDHRFTSADKSELTQRFDHYLAAAIHGTGPLSKLRAKRSV
jgi:predicted HTH transcriptional regulator